MKYKSIDGRVKNSATPEIVKELRIGLGDKMVTYALELDPVSILDKWEEGFAPDKASEEKMRGLFHAFLIITSLDSPAVARAWFVGMNPEINDEAPINKIREGNIGIVIELAKYYINF